MTFDNIIGQQEVKERLLTQFEADRLPHALMLCGPSGAGKLPLALSLAQLLLCQHPVGSEPCGQCPACQMTKRWAHPDLHFSFPVIKKKGSSTAPISDNYMQEWRQMLDRSPYFDINDWLAEMNAENQQAIYYVPEADNLLRKLAIKSSQGGKRVVILWLPERMNQDTANKLLKLIEEPPSGVHFILVSDEPDQVLGTILSRCQRIPVPTLPEDVIKKHLMEKEAMPEDVAANLAHVAQGSYTQARKQMQAGNEESAYFELFVSLMRSSYARRAKEMQEWSDKVAKMGREKQKHLLQYFQRLVRENFIYNFQRQSELNYMTPQEAEFSVKFARFINERNVIMIMEQLDAAQRDIEQNVSAKMVFFDFAVKLTILLKQ